jgi:lipoyl(octanoyl) transferase
VGGVAQPELVVEWLGRRAYGEVLALQHRLVAERIAGDRPDTLLLVEHDSVFTLGRQRTSTGNVLEAGTTPVVQVERGGDVTWHGPGQLVGYPIIKLDDGRGERDVHKVLRQLEEGVIVALATCGLEAERKPRYTGVWCQGKKVASLGVAVRGWVTYHGFAINVAPDMAWFTRINPCGLEPGVMGSIASLGGDAIPAAAFRSEVAQAVATAMGRRLDASALTPTS